MSIIQLVRSLHTVNDKESFATWIISSVSNNWTDRDTHLYHFLDQISICISYSYYPIFSVLLSFLLATLWTIQAKTWKMRRAILFVCNVTPFNDDNCIADICHIKHLSNTHSKYILSNHNHCLQACVHFKTHNIHKTTENSRIQYVENGYAGYSIKWK